MQKEIEAYEAQSKSTKSSRSLWKTGKRAGIRGWREGRGRSELTAFGRISEGLGNWKHRAD